MNTKIYSPITVNIYGENSDEFIRHKEELNEQGYRVKSYSDIESFLSNSNTSDISIVSLAMLENSDANSVSENFAPFMVYDFSNSSPFNNDASPLVHKAVGYFVDKPSSKDIGLKIDVGLLLHRERRIASDRLQDLNQKFEANRDIGIATGIVVALSNLSVQEAYELLRKVARNKRSRVSDLGKALIHNQALDNKLQGKESLEHWLDEVVLVNLERDTETN